MLKIWYDFRSENLKKRNKESCQYTNMKPYQQTIQEIIKNYQTDEIHGLSHEQAERRLQEQGPNTVPAEKPQSWALIFFRQFKSPLIFILLLAAAIIFFAAPDPMDAFIISGVVFFNAIIGTFQEKRAYNILESLKRFEQATVTCIRAGKPCSIPAHCLVKGDVVLLLEGQRIPADIRITQADNMRIDESLLTGESQPQLKNADPLQERIGLAECTNMAFSGSYILSGSGRGIVVATGLETEIGTIQRLVQTISTEIPLKKEIDHLSYVILLLIFGMCSFLFIIGIATGKPLLELLVMLTALFICVIPEGLPVVLTLVLVSGAYRMARNNVLVKHLQAVETLGRTDVIVIDKTGTLTRNEMIVSSVYADNALWFVTGEGYHVAGDFFINGKKITSIDPQSAFIQMQRASLLLNNTIITYLPALHLFDVKGDPTEAALFVCAQKAGLQEAELKNKYKKIYEIPFSSDLKYHAGFFTLVHDIQAINTHTTNISEKIDNNKQVIAYIIGSPETIMRRCAPPDNQCEKALEQLLNEGLRVIAMGMKIVAPEQIPQEKEPNKQLQQFMSLLEHDIELLGFAGIQDTIRPEVRAIITQVRAAGLQVIMATGDHRATALYVARQVGIFNDKDTEMDGTTVATLSDQALLTILPSITVFSRVSPTQKMRIIDLFHQQNKRVAMTGDGINDAPSLVAADIGIAMGRIGTQVAKEAADLVLLDDSFTNIIQAIKEGRHVFLTLQRVILYFFTTNMAELLLVLFALITNTPLPITAAQILWLNLVTDGFLNSALSMEPQEKDLLASPFDRKERLVNNKLLIKTAYMALPMGLGSFLLFSFFCDHPIAYARTISLITLSMFQWFNAWNCRSQQTSIFKLGLFSNKWLIGATMVVLLFQCALLYIPCMQQIFKTMPLSLTDWLLAVAVSSSILIVEEIRKYWLYKQSQI